MEPLSELSTNINDNEPEEPEKKNLKKQDNTKKAAPNKKEKQKPKNENSPKRKQPKKPSGNKENIKKNDPEKKGKKQQKESDEEDEYNGEGSDPGDEDFKEVQKTKGTKGKQQVNKAKASVKEKKQKGQGGDAGGKMDSDYITILEYMKEKNRPFNQTIIEGNLATKLLKKGKNVERVLSSLVDDKELIYKDYAKARIYLINQKHFPEVNRSEMEKMNEELMEKKENYSQTAKEYKELAEKLKKVTSEFTNDELEEEIKKLEKMNLDADEKLAFFDSDKYEKVSDQQINDAEKKKEKFLKEMKKRKRICNDMIGNLCETMEKKKSQIMDELGLELPE